jgi:hypothetical protein
MELRYEVGRRVQVGSVHPPEGRSALPGNARTPVAGTPGGSGSGVRW